MPLEQHNLQLSNVSPPADPPTSSSTPTPALSSTAAFPPTPPSLDQQQPLVEAANANKVALNVLVISGQRKTWRFDGEMTIGRVKCVFPFPPFPCLATGQKEVSFELG